MSRILLHNCLLGGFIILIFANCGTSRQSTVMEKSELFSLTNSTMDNQAVQVLKSTFGLGILPRSSDVTIRFGTNGSLHVSFNQSTLKPETILLESTGSEGKPEQSVFDSNADGIPDMRSLRGGENKQLFYMGKWHDYLVFGTNNIITFEGKKTVLFFNGIIWCENTNPPATPKIINIPEGAANKANGAVVKY